MCIFCEVIVGCGTSAFHNDSHNTGVSISMSHKLSVTESLSWIEERIHSLMMGASTVARVGQPESGTCVGCRMSAPSAAS
jgi:hypothetical protein